MFIALLVQKKKGEKIMTKRFGFTLAEVLITLGIIGVVAAMTIPTLISNTNGAQFKTAYKKALSTLNQAVLMNIAMDDTDFSTLAEDAATGETVPDGSLSDMLINRMQSATDITDSYFTEATTIGDISYGAGVLTCDAENIVADSGSPCEGQDVGDTVDIAANTTFTPSATTAKVYSFADGTSFGFNIESTNCTDSTKGTADNVCVGFIDVNGATGPNTVVKCDTGTQEGGTGDTACTVDTSGVTDIYPVYFHGQTVEPATDAARAVLFGK